MKAEQPLVDIRNLNIQFGGSRACRPSFTTCP